MKVGRKLMSWDQSAIIEDNVQARLENWEEFGYEKKPTEAEVRESVSLMDMDIEWDDLLDYLTEVIKRKNPNGYWRAEVKSFGWRGLDGHKYFEVHNGQEFLHKILPETECSFYIFNYGKGLALQNYHHDSPVGKEWYYIVPTGYTKVHPK
jgi:hypothetical protein